MCLFRNKINEKSNANKESKRENYKVPKFEKLKKEEIPQLFEEISKQKSQSSKEDDSSKKS